MDKLSLIKIFLTVIDHGSFVASANALGVSPSTISKAIARLEAELNVQLFYRSTRSLALTESGRIYATRVRDTLTELERCESELARANEQPNGVLKLNLPVTYGRTYIVPLMNEFTRLYPDIVLDMSFNDAYVDIIENSIDLSIRSGVLEDTTMIGRLLTPMDFITVASPSYIAKHREISANQYQQHKWIRFRFRQTGKLMPILIQKKKAVSQLDPGRDYVLDDGESMAALCAEGLGLLQLPHFALKQWLDSGKLVSVAPYYRHPEFAVWAIYAKSDHVPIKVKVFVDYLKEKLREQGESPNHTWAEFL